MSGGTRSVLVSAHAFAALLFLAGLVVLAGFGGFAEAQGVASELAMSGTAPIAPPHLTLQAPIASSADPVESAAGEAKSDSSWRSGLFTGMKEESLRDRARPLDSPLYFEDPYIQTSVRPIFLYHEFPEESIAGGGHLTVMAVQVRIALTERLALIATEDGYTDLEADALPEGDGWNDIAAGLKYALWTDRENGGIVSVGGRYSGSNGSRDVFQGIEDEVSLFVSGARGFGKVNCIAGINGRMPLDSDEGNDILSWDLHASYDVGLGCFPIVEYHGLVYLSDGDRLAVRDGLLDYGNLGAGDVEGSDVHWATIGLRQVVKPDVHLGLGYGFALQDTDHSDIMEDRIIIDLTFLY
jgi:hypothetical protein